LLTGLPYFIDYKMKNKKIILAGGNGFIGQEMTKYFGKDNQIIILSRQRKDARNNRYKFNSLPEEVLQNTRFVKWDSETIGDWVNELEGADIIINLAGRSVNCRYTEKNKKEILDSRVNSTRIIGEAIQQCQKPPELWINSSSATIYRDAEDRPQDEYSGELLDDFSVQVCKQWEKTFYDQPTPSTRKVVMRMGITLGPGGVMIPYFNLLKFGLGGRQGSGKQMFTWIHAEDTCRIMKWIYEHKEMQGAYNCCSPYPVTNKEFMKTLRKAAGHYFGLPALAWMVRLGAYIIGTEPELILKSHWVVPTRLLESGFQFRFPLVKDAIADVLSKVPRKKYHLV
jgi:uncharacterized protein (TIGR01777 family)